MARINFEDDVESRDEFRKLVKLLNGDDDKARGMLLRFWRIAQKYWGERRLVSIAELEFADLGLIIDSRWGIVDPEPKVEWELLDIKGVYAIGSEERFSWYRQKCDAGKKGGRPKKSDETGAMVPETETVVPETEIVIPKTGTCENSNSVNPLTPSPSPVPVPALSPVPDKNEENKTRPSSFDFLKLYQEYPRKDGKQEGLKHCKSQIKTQEVYDQVLSAVRRYRAQCERESTEKKFIRHFSSFMHGGKWRDWLDLDVGTSTVISKSSSNRAEVRSEGNRNVLHDYLNRIGGDSGQTS
jgi:hypothetical protein